MATQDHPPPSTNDQPGSSVRVTSPVVVASPINSAMLAAVRAVVQQEVRAALPSSSGPGIMSSPGTSTPAASLPLTSGSTSAGKLVLAACTPLLHVQYFPWTKQAGPQQACSVLNNGWHCRYFGATRLGSRRWLRLAPPYRIGSHSDTSPLVTAQCLFGLIHLLVV